MADNIKKVIEDDGTIRYYLGDLHHNPEGPAVIGFAGRHKEYWFKGLRHRTDGPAVEYADGGKEWWLDDNLHRIDGPAIEDADGSKHWYLDGNKLTQAQWIEAVQPKVASCVGKIVEVDGVKYRLVAA